MFKQYVDVAKHHLEDAKDEEDLEKDDKMRRIWLAYQHALISFQELVFFAKYLDGEV